MASLAAQKEGLLATLEEARSKFSDIADRSTGKASEELRGLYGGWVLEKLREAASAIHSIDVEKVKALREERQTTVPVFEAHIDEAIECLVATHGVKYSLDQLFKKKVHFSAEEIRGLGRVLRLTERAHRRCKIFRSRTWSRLASGWLWMGLLAVALLSIPTYRYAAVYLQSSSAASTSERTDAVVKQVEADVAGVQARASEPEKSLLSRAAAIVKDIWTLMDMIPKIFAALSGLWAVVLLWLRR